MKALFVKRSGLTIKSIKTGKSQAVNSHTTHLIDKSGFVVLNKEKYHAGTLCAMCHESVACIGDTKVSEPQSVTKKQK